MLAMPPRRRPTAVGREFYRQALADGQCFDAVVLDLTVRGGMGGREAAERILALEPSARLLVSSGYSDDAVMADYRRHGFAAALPKPYTAQQLRDVRAGDNRGGWAEAALR